jgi:hypothetical protein
VDNSRGITNSSPNRLAGNFADQRAWHKDQE